MINHGGHGKGCNHSDHGKGCNHSDHGKGCNHSDHGKGCNHSDHGEGTVNHGVLINYGAVLAVRRHVINDFINRCVRCG